MKMGSLFTGGCGGFDLAAEWAGIETAWQVEINPNAHKYLNKNFPNVPKYFDIHDCGKHNLAPVDIICGGFPCQPFSHSGKREGASDPRYIWPQMLRIITELQPSWVIGENVAGLASMAFPPLQTGMETETAIEEKTVHLHMEGNGILLHISEDLEKIGYEVQSLTIPAAAIGAPHRRDRIWILAHRNGIRQQHGQRSNAKHTDKGRKQPQHDIATSGNDGFTANPESGRSRGLHHKGKEARTRKGNKPLTGQSGIQNDGGPTANNNGERPQEPNTTGEPSGQERFHRKEVFECWNEWPTEPPVLPMDDGLPSGMDGAIYHLGNAVVPQIPYLIFQSIKQVESLLR